MFILEDVQHFAPSPQEILAEVGPHFQPHQIQERTRVSPRHYPQLDKEGKLATMNCDTAAYPHEVVINKYFRLSRGRRRNGTLVLRKLWHQ